MTTATKDATATTAVVDVTPEMLAKWLAEDSAVLVDVREDFEHKAEHIEGSESAPMSTFDANAVRARHGDERVVFHCRTGGRSRDAAGRYCAGGESAYHLAGGIEGWKKAGQPVVRAPGAPRIPVMRQVQIVAGSLVVIGVALGVLVSSWFLALSAFVGCGLVFAGISGWCGMARMLAAMPWNR